MAEGDSTRREELLSAAETHATQIDPLAEARMEHARRKYGLTPSLAMLTDVATVSAGLGLVVLFDGLAAVVGTALFVIGGVGLLWRAYTAVRR